MSKLMFKRGNLHTGNVYGVEVMGAFGSYEVHGPFSGENEAWNYGMGLAKASTEWESFALVTIETPFLKPIASPEAIRAHREHVGEPVKAEATCEECGGTLVGEIVGNRNHSEACSLHPSNIA